ncbi:N-acetylglucosamine/diacetylchitobiose ABC transporter substrate-binding protein [Streptomyces sp. NPDC060198]|uniref:N-acetylglucosamine/diacetylchitobiose ABC transporter substrate-binding protein n=1 Tax=Streptomyces sp. NPDC060198 TaxID=3347070 RepID=UPI00365F518A
MNSQFEVPANAPLEVVAHKAGYDDAFIRLAESVYQERFPGSEVLHTGVNDVPAALEPRFAAGNPPDLASSSGLAMMDLGRLSNEGQLMDLTPLLESPSVDDPGRTVAESLLPGTLEMTTFGGRCYAINYAYKVFDLFHAKSLFTEHGWEYPRTWEGMLELCAEIKRAGIAPWTYAGDFLAPLFRVLLSMATKLAGPHIVRDIDNLEPHAWRADAVVAAAEAMYELVRRDYILPGTSRMTYMEAQEQFVRGKAAFIPCGSWLESEMRGITPAGFEMRLAPVPSIGTANALPYDAVMAVAGEPFMVPTKAKNPDGGLELLRIITSRQVARTFSETTEELSVVAGAADGLPPGASLGVVRDVIERAGEHTFAIGFHLRYRDLYKGLGRVTAELMTGDITPHEWSVRCQRESDLIAADTSIAKYPR